MNNQNVIIIRQKRKRINRRGNSSVIKITGEAADILEDFCTRTGASACRMASEFIKYAAENTIVEVEEED